MNTVVNFLGPDRMTRKVRTVLHLTLLPYTTRTERREGRTRGGMTRLSRDEGPEEEGGRREDMDDLWVGVGVLEINTSEEQGKTKTHLTRYNIFR